MIGDKKILAVIPARGGSKRLPRKNILPLNGKPVIQWTIDAAKESAYIDEIVLSSDSDEIIDVGKESKVSVIKRPLELATDEAKSTDVLLHAISFFPYYDLVVLLQPTSPLRTSAEIDGALELLMKFKSKTIVSVCEVEHSPLWSGRIKEDLTMKEFFNPKIDGVRSQDLDTYYRLNGAIYISDIEQLKKTKTIWNEHSIAYIMDAEKSVDIDNKIDFLVAEALFDEMS